MHSFWVVYLLLFNLYLCGLNNEFDEFQCVLMSVDEFFKKEDSVNVV